MHLGAPSGISLVRALRDKLGWTQEQLAARAGVSIRVIAYAEAGQSIGKATAAALASTFESAGHRIDMADLLTNPAALARRFLTNYARHQSDCVRHSLDFLSPEIVAYVEGDPETNPIAGEYHGIEEFDRFWKTFFAIFVRDGGTLDAPAMIANGNEIVAWGHERIRIRNLPPQKATGFVMLKMQFDAGKMIRFEDYYEANGMMNALKRWAEEFPEAPWLGQVCKEAILNWQADEDATCQDPQVVR